MAKKKEKTKESIETELGEFIASFYDNPYGFVMAVYPWGEKDTILGDESGPDKWQKAFMDGVKDSINRGEAVMDAVASGHGVGKTTLVAWLIHWFLSTRAHPQAVITANTKDQLSTKTWRELSKWHKLSIHKEWFKWTATKFYKVDHIEDWFASAVPWSAERSEAFAGTHERHVLLIFDEASAIDDVIWEVASGAMTTEGAMFFAFGNPTRNSGRFKDCWGKLSHRWRTHKVDSRDAKKADKKIIQQWIDDYGEDSDFVRVRVRGEFPRSGSTQLIPSDVIEKCVAYECEPAIYKSSPVVLGCDVARFGDDQSVIAVRQGRKVHQMHTFRGLDTVEFTGEIIEAFQYWRPYAVFVDEGGIGAGVVDQLKQRGLGSALIPVTSQRVPSMPRRYFNKRAEMWCRFRDWMTTGADIPALPDLIAQLNASRYAFSQKDLIQIESKKDMKSRGVESPDLGDALALTFAEELVILEEQDEQAFEDVAMGQGRNSVTGY